MNKTRFIIFSVLSVATMVLIFMFSAHDSEKSSDESFAVGEVVAEIIVEDFDELPREEKISIIESIDHYVRKSAHFLEYTMLGFMLLNAGLGLRKKKLVTALICLAIGSFYAMTDEIHQYFVPGRACAATDWMIDTSGVLNGILVAFILDTLIFVIRRGKGSPRNNMVE